MKGVRYVVLKETKEKGTVTYLNPPLLIHKHSHLTAQPYCHNMNKYPKHTHYIQIYPHLSARDKRSSPPN